uniref:Uncharacterized protein n=1 Tax=Arundo donax TaxID=35708 RepID=A0A0A8YKR0_ARUDO
MAVLSFLTRYLFNHGC